MTKKRKKSKPEESLWEEERRRWLQAEHDAALIEEGNFICPFCQKYVDPLKWFAFIDNNPYDENRSFVPTLFHKGCSARVPEGNREWVKYLRELYRDSPVKPGDYVQFHDTPRWRKYANRPRRVVEVHEWPCDNLEDNTYYTVDIWDVPPRNVDPHFVGYLFQREAFDVVPRPYLKRSDSH